MSSWPWSTAWLKKLVWEAFGLDDTEDVIRRRQEVYTEQTAPLIEVYRERGILVEVDGMGEVDEVTSRLFAALDQRARTAS